MAKLIIHKVDPLARVEISDYALQPVDLADGEFLGGTIELQVKPGLYEVRQQFGAWNGSKMFRVGDDAMDISMPAPPVESILPAISAQPAPEGLGRLVISVADTEAQARPWAQLRAPVLARTALGSLANARVQSTEDLKIQQPAGDVDGQGLRPGTWLLRLAGSDGRDVVLPLKVVADRALHVRLDQATYGTWTGLDPLTAQLVSDPQDAWGHWRLAQVLRGMSEGHGVLASDAGDVGASKDWLLGLALLHGMLDQNQEKTAAFDSWLNMVQDLLGAEDPDVLAIQLRLGTITQSAIADHVVTPPMLRRSWHALLDAAGAENDAFGDKGVAAALAGHEWGESPWLVFEIGPDVLWTRPEAPPEDFTGLFEDLKSGQLTLPDAPEESMRGADKFVYEALKDYDYTQKGSAPSVSNIATKAGLPNATARRGLDAVRARYGVVEE